MLADKFADTSASCEGVLASGMEGGGGGRASRSSRESIEGEKRRGRDGGILTVFENVGSGGSVTEKNIKKLISITNYLIRSLDRLLSLFFFLFVVCLSHLPPLSLLLLFVPSHRRVKAFFVYPCGQFPQVMPPLSWQSTRGSHPPLLCWQLEFVSTRVNKREPGSGGGKKRGRREKREWWDRNVMEMGMGRAEEG